MAKIYSGLLAAAKDELEQICDEAVLTFSAELLFAFYRVTENSSKILLNAMRACSSRIWLPPQTISKYINNLDQLIYLVNKNIDDLRMAYINISTAIRVNMLTMEATHLLDAKKLKAFNKQFEKTLRDLSGHIKNSRSDYFEKLKKDALFELIFEISRNNPAEQISGDEVRKWKIIAIRRNGSKLLENFISDGGNNRKFRKDIGLWTSILAHAEKSGKPIVLITPENRSQGNNFVQIIGERWDKENNSTISDKYKIYLCGIDYFFARYAEQNGINNKELLGAIKEFASLNYEAVSASLVTENADGRSAAPNQARLLINPGLNTLHS